MTDQEKQKIDSMSQYELCMWWRFAPAGDSLFQGDTGDYYKKCMKEKGGFTPQISKSLG